MNWCEIQDHWVQEKIVLQSYWTRLPEKDLAAIAGDRGELGRALQRRYSLTEEKAEKAIAVFEKDVRCHDGTFIFSPLYRKSHCGVRKGRALPRRREIAAARVSRSGVGPSAWRGGAPNSRKQSRTSFELGGRTCPSKRGVGTGRFSCGCSVPASACRRSPKRRASCTPQP